MQDCRDEIQAAEATGPDCVAALESYLLCVAQVSCSDLGACDDLLEEADDACAVD